MNDINVASITVISQPFVLLQRPLVQILKEITYINHHRGPNLQTNCHLCFFYSETVF